VNEDVTVVAVVEVAVDPAGPASADPMPDVFVVLGPNRAPVAVVTGDEVRRSALAGQLDMAGLVPPSPPRRSRLSSRGTRYEFALGWVDIDRDGVHLVFRPVVQRHDGGTARVPGISGHDHTLPGEPISPMPWKQHCRTCGYENTVTSGRDQPCANLSEPAHTINERP
jgi:hypothetical protein